MHSQCGLKQIGQTANPCKKIFRNRQTKERSVKIASSLLGIILADFRSKLVEAIYFCRYGLLNLESKSGSKEPQNRQKNLYGTLPNPPHEEFSKKLLPRYRSIHQPSRGSTSTRMRKKTPFLNFSLYLCARIWHPSLIWGLSKKPSIRYTVLL